MNIITDITVKVLSLIAALFIWIYVVDSMNVTIDKEFDLIEIKTKYTDALESSDLVVQSMSYDTVNVVLTGTKNALRKVDASDIEAYIDLSGIREPGEYQCSVKLSVPTGFAASTMTDLPVTVYVDKPLEKVFTIDAGSVLYESWSLASGCEIQRDKTSINIDHIVIEGKTLDIQKVADVMIKTTAMGMVSTDVSSFCTVVLFDNDGRVIENSGITVRTYKGGTVDESGALTGDASTVREIVVGIKLLKEKEVPLTITTEYGYISSVDISPAYVTVKGSPAVVDKMNEISVGHINEKTVTTDSGVYKDTLSDAVIPDGISGVYDPDGKLMVDNIIIADVTANIGEAYELRIPSSLITVIGRGAAEAQLTYTVEEEYLTVLVRRSEGIDESIQRLLQQRIDGGESGLGVIIDASELDAGDVRTLPVKLMFSSDFEGKIYEIINEKAPYTLTVRVTK